jgi:hypothetical protein
MQRMITQTFTKSTTAAQRDAYFEEELKAREVEREGCVGHEFHMRILSYPECDQMSVDRLPSHEINFLLYPQTGVDITVQLLGYNTTNACLIKLNNIPFLEFIMKLKYHGARRIMSLLPALPENCSKQKETAWHSLPFCSTTTKLATKNCKTG